MNAVLIDTCFIVLKECLNCIHDARSLWNSLHTIWVYWRLVSFFCGDPRCHVHEMMYSYSTIVFSIHPLLLPNSLMGFMLNIHWWTDPRLLPTSLCLFIEISKKGVFVFSHLLEGMSSSIRIKATRCGDEDGIFMALPNPHTQRSPAFEIWMTVLSANVVWMRWSFKSFWLCSIVRRLIRCMMTCRR